MKELMQGMAELGHNLITRGFNMTIERDRLVGAAEAFATWAHHGQKRKYTGEPYVEHPRAVVEILKRHGVIDENMLAAAWMHDVVEDTHVSGPRIYEIFGELVGSLVMQVTDVSTPEDGNRAARKEVDRQHLGGACGAAQDIKLADLIHNIKSIVMHDPGFAKIYLAEKARVLEVLTAGRNSLQHDAKQMLEAGLVWLEN